MAEGGELNNLELNRIFLGWFSLWNIIFCLVVDNCSLEVKFNFKEIMEVKEDFS